MANWIKDLVSDTFGATIGITIRDFLGGLGKKGHEMAVKKIEDLLKDNPRTDLLHVLLAMDPADSTILWQRHLEAIATGTENTFARILGQALPRNAQGQIDMERAKEILTQIAQMDAERFSQIIEELNHDPIAQHIKHYLKHGVSFAEALLEIAAYSSGVVTRWGKQISQQANCKADEMNNRTRFGQLARRLIK